MKNRLQNKKLKSLATRCLAETDALSDARDLLNYYDIDLRSFMRSLLINDMGFQEPPAIHPDKKPKRKTMEKVEKEKTTDLPIKVKGKIKKGKIKLGKKITEGTVPVLGDRVENREEIAEDLIEINKRTLDVRLPTVEPKVLLRASSYFMNNREFFINFINPECLYPSLDMCKDYSLQSTLHQP